MVRHIMEQCLQCLNPINEQLTIINFYRKPCVICETCFEKWNQVKINDALMRCKKCLKLMTKGEHICEDCQFLNERFNIQYRLKCNFNYDGIMKETMHQYKFLKDHHLCKVLAAIINLPEGKFDYVIPIPSPDDRNIERTFNPVEEVLKMKGIAYVNVLGTQLRPKQAELNKIDRLRETNPFFIRNNVELDGKEILLVDDIYTTGLTINRALCKLSTLNVRKFNVFAFAR